MTNKNFKISAALIVGFALIVAIAAVVTSRDEAEPVVAAPAEATAPTGETEEDVTEVTAVRAKDARRLGPKGESGVTFTEFLDFECEACLAAFPLVEELREKYAGKITFNVRYFPIASHGNAQNAAIAVEAAAQQGEFEAMYKKMYETQTEWSEQQVSKADLFREFAEEMGLDMDEYDKAVADPATLARVQEDLEAGQALGVQGTPTFFIDETLFEPQSPDDFEAGIEEALAGK